MNTLDCCPICNKPFGDDRRSCRLFDLRQYSYKMVMCYTHQIAVELDGSILNHLKDQKSPDLLSLVKDYVEEDDYKREIYRFYYRPYAYPNSITIDPKINVVRLNE